MSESIERLSKFTPDASGLDRDALLFAAGRVSARPGRRWRALCAALTASQLVTLAILAWPRPVMPHVPIDRGMPVAVKNPSPAVVEEKSTLWQLRAQALATEGDLPSPAFVEASMASEPPLHALGVFPESLFD
jgi:hypothetical protein